MQTRSSKYGRTPPVRNAAASVRSAAGPCGTCGRDNASSECSFCRTFPWALVNTRDEAARDAAHEACHPLSRERIDACVFCGLHLPAATTPHAEDTMRRTCNHVCELGYSHQFVTRATENARTACRMAETELSSSIVILPLVDGRTADQRREAFDAFASRHDMTREHVDRTLELLRDTDADMRAVDPNQEPPAKRMRQR